MEKTTYRILADGVQVDNDTWATGLNNNDLIIGPSGGGKTRGYVMPNLLQCAGSTVTADTKGRLLSELGPALEREGVQIGNLDFTDCLHSLYGYNPLAYVRHDEKRDAYNEQDIMTIAACIVTVESDREPFWEYAARMVLESIIGYVLECLPPEEHHLGSVVDLFGEMRGGAFRRLFEELCEISPHSFAAMRYRAYMTCVETARYVSVKANKSVNTVLDMPVGEAWLFARGQAPRRVRRFDVSRHPRNPAA